MRTTVIAFCVLGFELQVGVNLWAGSYELVRRIENPKGQIDGAGDEFGISVGFVGENVLVGAYREDTGAENAGAAYLFDSHGNLLTTFHNPDPTEDGFFGWNVGILGDDILVSAYGNLISTPNGDRFGAVYLFNPDGTLIQRFDNPFVQAESRFGLKFAGVGDRVFISDPFDATMGQRSGSLHVFDDEGRVIDTVFNPMPDETNHFGAHIAADANRILVRSIGMEANSIGGGVVHQFDTNAALVNSYFNPSVDPDNGFGLDLEFVGQLLVIGAYRDDSRSAESGAVFLFDNEGNVVEELSNPTPGFQEWFGRDIAIIDQDTLLIGAVFDGFGADKTGAAYLISIDGMLIEAIPNPSPLPSEHFATSVAASATGFAIGSNFDEGRFTGSGAVYVYSRVPEPRDLPAISAIYVIVLGAINRLRCRRRATGAAIRHPIYAGAYRWGHRKIDAAREMDFDIHVLVVFVHSHNQSGIHFSKPLSLSHGTV